MNSFSSLTWTARALIGVMTFVCALGAPSLSNASKWTCPASLAATRLTVKATGIEVSSKWALLSFEKEDLLLDEGGKVERCLELTRVRNNSVVIKFMRTGEEREFFFGGFSSVPASETKGRVSPGDGFMKAVTEHAVNPVSAHVTKISYPMYSNNNTLPQTIYRNDRGDALFEDLNQLGLGANAQPADPASGVEGVRIGNNSRDSVLGSLGISEGDHLVAINGHFVSSAEEVGKLLKEFSREPIQIGYSRGDDPAIYSTATMIQKG